MSGCPASAICPSHLAGSDGCEPLKNVSGIVPVIPPLPLPQSVHCIRSIISSVQDRSRGIMTCTTTRACAAWAVAIVALIRLPSLDGFSPSAGASRPTLPRGMSGSGKHSNDIGRQCRPFHS